MESQGSWREMGDRLDVAECWALRSGVEAPEDWERKGLLTPRTSKADPASGLAWSTRIAMAIPLTALFSSSMLCVTAAKVHGSQTGVREEGQGGGGNPFKFEFVTVTLLQEVGKLLVSLACLAREVQASAHTSSPPIFLDFFGALGVVWAQMLTRCWPRCLLYCIPGLLYCVETNMQYIILGYLQPAELAVLWNFKLFATVLLLHLFLKRRYSRQQWGALALLVVGCAMTQAKTLHLHGFGSSFGNPLISAFRLWESEALAGTHLGALGVVGGGIAGGGGGVGDVGGVVGGVVGAAASLAAASSAASSSLSATVTADGSFIPASASSSSSLLESATDPAVPPEGQQSALVVGSFKLFALALTILGSSIAASGNVLTEWLVKQSPQESIYFQNIQLYTFGVILNLFALLGKTMSEPSSPIHGPGGFFSGYNFWVWMIILVGSVSGLAISAALKHGDNILLIFSHAVSVLVVALVSRYIFEVALPHPFFVGATFIAAALMLFHSEDFLHEGASTGSYFRAISLKVVELTTSPLGRLAAALPLRKTSTDASGEDGVPLRQKGFRDDFGRQPGLPQSSRRQMYCIT